MWSGSPENIPQETELLYMQWTQSQPLQSYCALFLSPPTDGERMYVTLSQAGNRTYLPSASGWKSPELKQLAGMFCSWLVHCLNNTAALGCKETYAVPSLSCAPSQYGGREILEDSSVHNTDPHPSVTLMVPGYIRLKSLESSLGCVLSGPLAAQYSCLQAPCFPVWTSIQVSFSLRETNLRDVQDVLNVCMQL